MIKIKKKRHILCIKRHAQWTLGHSKYLNNRYSNYDHSKNSFYNQIMVIISNNGHKYSNYIIVSNNGHK